MSFSSGGGGGFGGSEEVLAYMIKAYDMATPVFRAFGGEVEATTKKIRASLASVSAAAVETDKAVVASTDKQMASLAELDRAYKTAGVKSADLAKMQADVSKQSVAAADAQAAAAKRTAAAQEKAAVITDAAATRTSRSLQRAGKVTLEVMAGGAIASLDFATKFQANTLRMETQAGATAAGLDKIRQGLLKMAGQVGFTPDQLANGMYHVVSSMNAVLPATTRVTQELQIMKVAAEGAQIGHSNLEDTTYALSAAMNALHVGARQATSTMAELNAIVGSGDMTMQDLVDAMKSGIIPAAQTFGISLQSVGAALAVMGDMGMRGALAGTRLRMAISLLAAPTKEAANILETLGMSSGKALATTQNMSALLAKAGISVTTLSQDLRRPDGLKVALQDLDSHLRSSGLSADAAGAAIDRAFGGGRMGATIKLLAENTDRLGLKFGQISGLSSRFGTDWKQTTEILRVQWDKALASLEAFGIELGTKMMPYAVTAIHDLEDMANWFIKNKTALDLLGAAVGTFASIAIGTYLIGKLKAAVSLVKEFGGSMNRVGGLIMGYNTAPGVETRSPLTQSQLEQSMARSNPVTNILGGAGAGTSALGMWGVSGTQIRVGTLMNPVAVVLASGSAFGAAGQATNTVAAEVAGGGPAATASAKAARDQVDAELKKIDHTMQAAVSSGALGLNKAGRYYDPATGHLMSQSQAFTAATIAGTPPGSASLAEMRAAEASAAAAGPGTLMWHATAPENVSSITTRNQGYPWLQGLVPSPSGELYHHYGVAGAFMANDPAWAHALANSQDFTERGKGSLLRVMVPPGMPLTVDPEHYSMGSTLGVTGMPEGTKPRAFYATENIPPENIRAAGTLAQEEAALRAHIAEKQLFDARQGQLFQDTNLFQGGLGAEAAATGQLSLFGQTATGRTPAELNSMSRMRSVMSESLLPSLVQGQLLQEEAALKGSRFSGLGGALRGAGGGLMRGAGVAGMGVMGAQMVGMMIPGQVGQTVSNVGSMAALGAGIGTAIEPGIGTAIGGTLGGVGALIAHFLSGGSSFGQRDASRLTPGFGGAGRQTLQQQVSKAIDAMAGIVHPGTRPTESTPHGTLLKEINTPFNQLDPTQQAKYMSLAKEAGGKIAQQLEKGWAGYKFQSEPIMFTQLKAELRGMPPAVQAQGVKSAVSFAEGLVKAGKLPAGAASQMLSQIEQQFPGFEKYLGISAKAGIDQFNKALDFSNAQDSVKSVLDTFRTQFPQVTAAMDSAGADISKQSDAVSQSLLSIIHGPHSTEAMVKQATADLKRLQDHTGQSFTQMAGLVSSQTAAMASSITVGSATATKDAAKNWNKYAQSVGAAMAAGSVATDTGMKLIVSAMNSVLNALGENKLSAAKIQSASPATLAGLASGTVSSFIYGGGAATPRGHWSGGKVHEPTYMVGEEGPTHPEYVLATNPAYRNRNVQLWAQYAKEVGIPGFAQGGYVFPFPRGEKFGWDRIDQGQDLQGPPGGPVLAIGPGRVSVGHDTFGGFGPFYPVEQLDSGPWAGRSIYYGHIKDTVTGLVRAGQTIGYTQAQQDQWTAAPAGWLELGFTSALGHGIAGQGAAVAPMLHALVAGHMVAGTGGGPGIGSIHAPKVTGGGLVGSIAQAALNIATKATNQFLSQIGGGGLPTSGGGNATANQKLAKSMLGSFGWGQDQWPPLDLLWNRESNWNQFATNPSSDAYGIPQSLPGDKMASAGPDWRTNPATQEKWGLGYIHGRYGSPAAAWGHETQFGWYGHGGRVGYAGAFGQGGSFTAYGPTLGLFGEGGVPESVFAVPHFKSGGATSGPVTLGVPNSQIPTASNTPAGVGSGPTYSTTVTSPPVISGGDKSTTTTTTSTNSKGQTTVHTHTSVRPIVSPSTSFSTHFNPLTDQIETHSTKDWATIHAEYSKQRHDAAQAKQAYDKWLGTQVKDMLGIGGVTAGAIDLTRKQAIAEHLPTGGKTISLSGSLKGMTDQGFTKVLAGLKHYLAIDDLSDTMKLLRKDMATLGKNVSDSSRQGQIASTLIAGALKGVSTQFSNQTKRFAKTDQVLSLIEQAPAGTTARSLGFTGAQLKSLSLTRREIRNLAGTDSGPGSLKQQIGELSSRVIPDYRRDAKQLTQIYHDALKTHNKKLASALLAQLDAVSQAEAQAIADKQKAQVSLVEAVYQKGQTKAAGQQSATDLIGAVARLPAGTSLASIGLSKQTLKTLGLGGAGVGAALSSIMGGANPMMTAQGENLTLGAQRSTDVATLNQLVTQLPSLKGSAADQATQHIQDLSKAVASLTQEMNTNLMDAIKAVAQGFQDQADLAQGGVDALGAIADMPAGTNLASLGIGPGLLATLGIDPGTAAAVIGGGPAAISAAQNAQGGQLTPGQLSAARNYYTGTNQGIQNELGGPDTGLIGELNYDYSQLGSLTGSDRTDMIKSILGLVKTIGGLERTMDDNTKALGLLTNATNASTTATGQMTGTTAYTYRGQSFSAGLSSDSPINFGVGF